MKATELMIGDWVKSRTGMNVKIVGINHDYPSVYEPIPLTAEILEKNGWWQDEIDGTYHNTMSVYGRKAPFSILDGVAINYVHELQQALRLCGLKDLADNFKI